MILLCEVLLVTLILLTFFPSLHHVFRADHWKYLSYVRSTEGFLDTWSSTYSLTRQTDHGDSHLFRPLLFGCLALERSLFSADIQKYQLVNLFLHTANTCLLFLVLCRLVQVMCPAEKPAAAWPAFGRSHAVFLLPLAASALFAVNVPGSEMVIWSHIVAYQMWILLFLGILYCLLGVQSGRRLGKVKHVALWCAIFCMSLIYEITFPIGVVIAGFAAHLQTTWRNKSAVFLWFLSPLLFSAAINVADYWHWGRPIQSSGQCGALLPTLCRTYFYLVVQPFFPGLNHPQAGRRTFLPITKPDINQVLFSVFGLMLAFALFCVCTTKDRCWRARVIPWVLAMASIAMVQGMLITTRLVMHPMGLTLLWGSSYYCHFFVIYVLFAFVATTSSQATSASAWRRFCVDCVSLALLAVALNSATTTRQLCESYAVQSRPAIECSRQIDAFIRRQIERDAPPRIGCTMREENDLGLCKLDQLLDLYPKYHALSADQATHLAFYRNGGIEIVPRKSD
jgi:hypothetical protein